MDRSVIIAVLVTLIGVLDVYAGEKCCPQAKTSSEEGEVSSEVKQLLKRVDAGDVVAMREMEQRYSQGRGVPKDYSKAYDMCVKLAKAGDTRAMVWAGMYNARINGSEGHEETVKWYEMALEKGSLEAAVFLCGLYRNGDGFPVDTEKADKGVRIKGSVL